MIVNHYSWARVEIRYDKPVPVGANATRRKDELKDAHLFYSAEDHTLTVKDVRTGDGMANKHFTFANASVKRITPWGAEFEAYWWSSSNPKQVRCDIVCTFEDRE